MRKVLDVRPIAVEPAPAENLDWVRLFGNDNPVEVEIGTGKAGFLLQSAQSHPQRNFLGIEWARKFYRLAADRLRRWNVTNARMLRTDADHFIRVLCPPESLHALHVYHPDPWPKKRHHKRRLFNARFVDAAVACLIDGGRLAVQTDHAEYFGVIRNVLLAHTQLEEVPFDQAESGVDGSRPATNYEAKYLREGRRIHQMAVVRRKPRS